MFFLCTCPLLSGLDDFLRYGGWNLGTALTDKGGPKLKCKNDQMVTLTERAGKFVGMICSMKRVQEMKGSYDDEEVRITTNKNYSLKDLSHRVKRLRCETLRETLLC